MHQLPEEQQSINEQSLNYHIEFFESTYNMNN
jgi:hypothetical protein